MTTVILKKDREQQEGDSVECDPKFEARCSSPQFNLLWKGDFNDLVRDFNLSKKEAELLGSRLREWNLPHQDNEICFFRNRQNEFREFFSKKTIWCLLIMFSLLQRLFDTKTIHLSSVCLLTLQKLA